MTLVRWTGQAVDDLRAIREFIERDSPQYGRLVAERLFDATQRLERFPLSGRVVPELGRDDVREIILGEYRIVYRLKGETARSHHGVPVFAALSDYAFGPLNLWRAL